MKNFLKRLFSISKNNGIPKLKKDIWYNQSIWDYGAKYPKVFDEGNIYIHCEVGLEVQMGETKDGKKIFYKVTRMWNTKGGDFAYESDCINCDMKFSRISE